MIEHACCKYKLSVRLPSHTVGIGHGAMHLHNVVLSCKTHTLWYTTTIVKSLNLSLLLLMTVEQWDFWEFLSV